MCAAGMAWKKELWDLGRAAGARKRAQAAETSASPLLRPTSPAQDIAGLYHRLWLVPVIDLVIKNLLTSASKCTNVEIIQEQKYDCW